MPFGESKDVEDTKVNCLLLKLRRSGPTSHRAATLNHSHVVDLGDLVVVRLFNETI